MKETNGCEGSKTGLGAYLSPWTVIALSFGYAVGWGSFVMPGTAFLPGAGPLGTFIGVLIGAVVMSVFALNYHRMVKRTPGPGGVFSFAVKAFGADHGFLIAWFLVLTYVAIMWANATALVLLLRYLFGDAFQFGLHYTMAGFDVYLGECLMCVLMIAFAGGACLFRKRFAVGLHTLLAGVFVLSVAVCFCAALWRHEGGFAALSPAFAPDGSNPGLQIVRILAMIPWAFVGFEAVVNSSGEFRFPVKRTFGLLIAAITLSALVYLLLALLPVLSTPDGFANWSDYIAALPGLQGISSMPVFSAAKRSLGPLGLSVIGSAMLSAQLTALFATYIALSRLMRAMADDGMIPKWLGRCNEEGTPVNAVLTVMCVSLPIPFLGRTVIGWPVDLSNLGAAIAYGYTSAAVLALLRKGKECGHCAEKAAGIFGLLMAVVFSLLMLVPNYLSGSSLSTESYLLLSIWCFAGFLLYRHVFVRDTQGRLGNSILVWITVLIVIFFSSLMWFRLAVCDSAEFAFDRFIGKTVTAENARETVTYVNADMLFKSIIELCILVSSLAIIVNLITILRKREKSLILEKLKAEESVSQAKSYFFSTISHDIRTPLNAIIGYSQMLKMGFRQEKDRLQALEYILTGGKILLRVIDDAIDFSKLEDGCLEFDRKTVDCPRLLRFFMDSYLKTRLPQGVEFRCNPGEMPCILLDPKRIRQILFHLLDNAAKFTKEGFVELRASFEKDGSADTGTLRIEVEDTGCGISAEDLKKITSPYVQVDSKMARHGGTGIGLAVCRKLAEAMGGELSIASVPGKGSVFTVTLFQVKTSSQAPAEEEEKEEKELVSTVPATPEAPPKEKAPEEEKKAEEPAENVSPKKVLIVDDQKVNLVVLRTMLKKLGSFEIVMAGNGQEAFEILSSAEVPFDLVLTDMWMPVMDGEGLVRAIRADGKLSSLPVHVVTADTEMPGKFRQIGFDGILLKPVTVEKLKGLVNT